MRVHVTDLKPGDTLSSDTFNTFGIHMMQKGHILQPDDISKLLKHGLDYVDIEETVINDDNEPHHSLIEAKVQFDTALVGFQNLFLNAASRGEFDGSQVDAVLEPLMDELHTQKDVVSVLFVLNDTNNYTYTHSLQVGMLSYYLAIWMGYTEQEAYAAGRAGYLHDVGKAKVPPEILNKPGKLTPEEYEIMKKHAQYGHDIIMESTGDELSAIVALQHHERADGKGYPNGITLDDIHPYARITAVADIYSAMTTHRVYQSKQELLRVLKEIHRMSFGQLYAEAAQTFIRNMLPNMIGKKVRLNSGETGRIIMTNPTDYFRPLIETEQGFKDLSIQSALEIEEIFI
ncbi:HD-GYP domain-containing protein [Paenibacillus bovis]|uniref:HD family phosphohydrolase n=1 Tax=Paenibacillus bovis TaxID=1616788 RepID=A0A172ZFE9_9BACL|nr:HD-GYP domain-containing protein [Paenibacillus bovis]ANF96259.1 HD family phosphohydrolase [Paenibacillus bovis]